MQALLPLCKQWTRKLSGRSARGLEEPLFYPLSRIMQAWLFLSDFWTTDRVRSYLSKVPVVSDV